MAFDWSLFLDALFSNNYLMGALTAIILAVVVQAAGMLLGLLLALFRMNGGRPGLYSVTVFTWAFRALPVMLLLVIAWTSLPQIVPIFQGEWYTPFVAAFVAMTLSEAAFMSELLRGSFMAVDPGQKSAAKVLGLNPLQAFRWVTLPQVVKVAIPPTGNRLIIQIQLTSLTSAIALEELLTMAGRDVTSSFRYAEFYGAAAVYYLVIVSLFMLFQKWLEQKFKWETKLPSRPKDKVHEDQPASL